MADRLISADALKANFPKDTDWDYPVYCPSEICELIDSAPTVEAIPLEWIEKQKAECYPRSLAWIALEALLRTWKEEKDEVEE